MSLRKIIGSLLTPTMGMFPVVAFLVVSFFFSYSIALSGAIVTFVLFFVIHSLILKQYVPYSTYFALIAFLLSAAFSFINPFHFLYEDYFSLFFEVLLVAVFSCFLLCEDFYRNKKVVKDEKAGELYRMRIREELHVVKIFTRLTVAHLILVLIYFLLPGDYHSEFSDKFFYFIVIYVFIAFWFIYEFINLYFLRKKYLAEEWLPVVDETGTVHGKVASSISESSGNKYLHPVVRIALIHKGMLFLKKKKTFRMARFPELDYPFETYLRYRETLEEGVKRSLEAGGGTNDLSTHYLFHYLFKDLKTNRLIYLYVTNVRETDISSLPLGEGKWWTKKQIEENLGKGFFSACLEKEFELLSGTILQADRVMQGVGE